MGRSWRRLQWIDLPGDVTTNILQRLDAKEILETTDNVCTSWRSVYLDPAIWRFIQIRNPNHCRRIVDHSHGQLVQLSVQNFGDDDLLNYIVHRSRGLKRLSLEGWCIGLTGKGLIEAIKMLPHLEELYLRVTPTPENGYAQIVNSITDELYPDDEQENEAILDSCPNLQKFVVGIKSLI